MLIVGSMSYFQRWDIDVDLMLIYLHLFKVGVLMLIQCWPMLQQHWTDDQNDVAPTLYCNIGLTNWWRYPNVVPTNDCYLEVYFFKYWFSVSLIFTFSKCHRNQLFLYFLWTYRIFIPYPESEHECRAKETQIPIKTISNQPELRLNAHSHLSVAKLSSANLQ